MSMELPRLEWFLQKQGKDYMKNVYTGSVGTDPKTGCVNTKTLNFNISVDTEDEENIKFSVFCYIQLPFSVGGGRENELTREFPFGEEGKSELALWLEGLAKEMTEG